MNNLTISGRIATDINYSELSKPMATFNLAVKKNREDTDFFRVKCFNDVAQVVDRMVEKGSRVIVIGRINLENYVGKDQQKKSYVEIIAGQIEIIDFKKKDEEPQSYEEAVKPLRAMADEEDFPF